MTEKFSSAAALHSICTDYAKLDCITSMLMGLLSRSQPLAFWEAFLPVFESIFRLHGANLLGRENDRFLKQVAFHLLRLAVFRNDSIRKHAIVGLQILIRVCLNIYVILVSVGIGFAFSRYFVFHFCSCYFAL
jgi:dedicator of cytokinesis protein 6/7/8